ncbi:MAG: hypothetical protein JXA30_14215 [Deltaproteobacteria bacterium]|nr:hypothetical protein [Deltaproteobacteria bacterium]
MSITTFVTRMLCVIGLCCAAACETQFTEQSPTGGTADAAGAAGGEEIDWGKVASSGSGGGNVAPISGTGGSVPANTGGGGGTVVNPSTGGAGGSVGPSTGGAGGTVGPSTGGAGGAVVEPTGGAGGQPEGTGGTPAEEEEVITCPPPGALRVGDNNDTILINGVTRNYVVHVPASYTGDTPVPLVTDWHPILFDNATQQRNSGFLAKSEQEGFIVVWPNGIDRAWNVGSCCTTSRDVDDVGFARGLVAKLSTQLCIDKKRVYANGWSMGGGMSLKLACDATDLIAAAAPAAFDLMIPSEQTCTPSRAIPIFSTRGLSDVIVPYNGGPTNPPNGLPVIVTFMGAKEHAKWWADFNGCQEGPSAADSNNCETYTNCRDGVEVVLCTNVGAGQFFGHNPGNADLIWPFFQRFSLP